MTAPDTQPQDTQSADALWWEALQVMGGEPSEWTGDRWTIEVGPVTLLWNKPLGLFAQWNAMAGQYGRIDQWNLFGLVVEWVEARGLYPMGKKWFSTKDESQFPGEIAWSFGVYRYPVGDWIGMVKAPDLPTAAARWVVEHGAKISKEQQP